MVIRFNTNIEELTLSGISGAPKEGIQMLAESLSENTLIGLKRLDISDNPFVEDKGSIFLTK